LPHVKHVLPPLSAVLAENGADVPGENGLGLPFVLRDPFRIKYLHGYIGQVNLAVKEDKVPVIGYFAWSLLDNFEWADGEPLLIRLVRHSLAVSGADTHADMHARVRQRYEAHHLPGLICMC
jgi:Glycosyl hydrolase family 1